MKTNKTKVICKQQKQNRKLKWLVGQKLLWLRLYVLEIMLVFMFSRDRVRVLNTLLPVLNSGTAHLTLIISSSKIEEAI